MLEPFEEYLRRIELKETLCTGDIQARGVFELSGTLARGKDVNSLDSTKLRVGRIERPL
jgi:hypothetical protein